ncbi:hypothetical protein BJ944DRAFT_287659 [Cunninghamella echinulata]|nr:hypothetical protein BJ944DRAFT_287659 [Cunninghamella echinulata]
MQTSKPSPTTIDVKKKQRRRRRRRQRNKRNQPTDNQKSISFSPSQSKEICLDLKDLSREAYALEKQLHELQTQLKINYANIPKDQGRRGNAIAIEQVTATEDEIDYVRKSLNTVYRQILTKDLLYASSQHIEDKIWRYIFYPKIEEIRNRLRKFKSNDQSSSKQNLINNFYQFIDSSFKFYRDLNSEIKNTYHIDTKTIGIDVFRHQISSTKTEEDDVAILLQSNYICMGDLARYRASIMSSDNKDSKSSSSNAWHVSKTCYQKAVDVYRASGKPYSQLALISASTGSVIDVVWYYCMSLAMKFPSKLGYDNLKSFYSKVRFMPSQQNNDNDSTKPSQLISRFVESFLQMHQIILFQNSDKFPPLYNGLELAMEQAINMITNNDSSKSASIKSTSSILQIIRSTLTRTITIILISIWHISERVKDKVDINQRSEFQNLQMILLECGFKIITNVYKASLQSLERVKNSEPDSSILSTLEALVESTILPGLSIWSTYLYSNLEVISQYCFGADGRHFPPLPSTEKSREITKRALIKSIQTFCSFLIGHSSFPQPFTDIPPSTYPLSEDILLLGVVPLFSFHNSVDFFKEASYPNDEKNGNDLRKQVRWERVRELMKKMADSTSFNFVQYNQSEQKYSVIDENAKRQQQNRFMKALATQRLMEQVSSLEKNVNKMSVSTNNGKHSHNKAEKVKPEEMEVYTVVVDVTAFLDGLNKVKRWANQTLNVRQRVQTSILQVIAPLDVIDVLDQYKKGDTHMNLQARESIRYLDQQLALLDQHKSSSSHHQENMNNNISNSNGTLQNNVPTRSFLRTQKMNENLSDWEDAALFWIGKENQHQNNEVEEQKQEKHDDNKGDSELMTDKEDQEPVMDSDNESTSSNDDLLKIHGRRRRYDNTDDELTDTDEEFDTDDDDSFSEGSYSDDESDEEHDDTEEYDNEVVNQQKNKEKQEQEESTYDHEHDHEGMEKEKELTYLDVPKKYRPIISCMLYYHQHKKSVTNEQIESLVLVTNDDELAWWANLFGNPTTGKRLYIQTVKEWDRILTTMSFGKTHDKSPSWRR